MAKKVLILGSGGRENAIVQTLWDEGHTILAAPGNPGIARFGRCLDVEVKKPFEKLGAYVMDNDIDFVVVGPEALLADGIVDTFNRLNRPTFGPTAPAARVETSKAFCCRMLGKAGVPIPKTIWYFDFESMGRGIRGLAYPFVIKYDGLFAGKGVAVVRSDADQREALDRLRGVKGQFLIQECVEGPELSFFVLTDGLDFLFLGSAQDYKALYVGGPMTGGMGGLSPHPLLSSSLKEQIERTIVAPTIKALADAGCPYRGVMYVQVMLTKDGPVVIEINCRFGDPETQLLMRQLDCDLLPLMEATTKYGVLRTMRVNFRPHVTVGIVMTSDGYPSPDYKKGLPITGIKEAEALPGVSVYHAGTAMVDGQLVTAGGRVLTVTARQPVVQDAVDLAKEAVRLIHFEGAYSRDDICKEYL